MNNSADEFYLVSLLRQFPIVLMFMLCTNFSFSQLPPEISGPGIKSNFSEELYVMTDRDIYIAGEKVFLKVVSYGRLTHVISAVSTVAYISLLDQSGNPVLQAKIRIGGSSGSGFFTLPDSLRTGNYAIATCTHWMQNFSPELFSYKNICVINPFRNFDNLTLPSRRSELDTVIFYPESGNIIAGVENIIGFRSIGLNMDPVEINGVVTDSIGHILCNVQSDNDGYGIFRVTPPVRGRLYLKTDTGNMKSGGFKLPSVIGSGIGLTVVEEPDNDIFRVKVSKGIDIDTHKLDYRLIYAHVALDTFVLKTAPVISGEIILKKTSLPSGLASIIVADDKGNSYARRWIYNNPKQNFNITVITDEQSYSEREKVKIDILTTDSGGKAVKGNLVVSAVRMGTLTKTEDKSKADLQISGLPLGNWRQREFGNIQKLIFLKYKDTLSTYYSEEPGSLHLPEPDGHIISGIIRSTATGEPLRQENLVLSFVGKTALCRFTKTNDDGRFVFISPDDGTRELVIQPLSPELDEYYVELDNPYPNAFSRSFSHSVDIDTGLLESINRAVISMQVKRIYDAYVQNKTVAAKRDMGNDFYGLPEFTTMMSDFIQLSSLREALKEVVPGAITTSRNGKTWINTINKRNYQIEIRDPLVIVDGVPVFDHEKVLNIQGDKIEKIDVLNTGYVISDISLDGIIDITTKNGDLSSIEFDKPVFRQEFESLQAGSGFSSPDYSEVSQKMSRIPDFRNTLYWNPDVKTDENGRANIEFYASDEPDDYILHVEGFTSDGQRGYATIQFSIKSNKENN